MRTYSSIPSSLQDVWSALLLGLALFCFSVSPARAAVHVLQFTTATGPNLAGHVFYLDDPNLNGKPTAKLIVTQRLLPTVVSNNHPIGVWFDVVKGMWSVFNEDESNLAVGIGFNVLVCPAVAVNASALNSVDNLTFFAAGARKPPFTQALPAGKKPGFLFFTHNFEPFKALKNGVVVNHNQSLDYNLFAPPAPQGNKWYIANEDNAPALAASYFVLDASTPPKGAAVFGHSSTLGNVPLFYSPIDNAATNEKPDVIIFISPLGNKAYSKTVGVFYLGSSKQWEIVNEDLMSDFPAGKSFNVLVFPGAENVP